MRRNWIVRAESENEWMSISDLMSVLMIIFLFIAISYMQTAQQSMNSAQQSMEKLQQGQLNIKKVAVAYQELQTDLYLDLWEEFKDDLSEWKAVIEKDTLTVRFQEPEVLFAIGSSELSAKFRSILKDFFPRYVRIISSDTYKNNIEEIRIEGHTSSEWNGESQEMEAYFNNMRLSQNRTRSVLQYCLSLVEDPNTMAWSKKFITANGLASSQLIKNEDDIEDKEKSRRVEFRTKTNAEKKVVEIIDRMEEI